MKLSVRISLIVVFVILACGAATSLFVSMYLMRTLQARMLGDVDLVVRSVAPSLVDAVLSEDPVSSREILQGIVSRPDGLAFAYLRENGGAVLAHTFENRFPEALAGKTPENPGKGGHAYFSFEEGGRSYLVGVHPLFQGTDIGSVYIGIDRKVFEREIRRINLLILSLCLAVSVAGILVSVVAATRITRPLSDLAHSISLYGTGTSEVPPTNTGGWEVSLLGEAFRGMVESRNRAEDSVRFQNALLEAQSETGIDGILTVSPEGKVVYCNKRFLKMWSIPEDADKESDEKLLQSVLGQLADPEAFRQKVNYLYARPNEKSMDEILFKDGRTFERYSSPLTDSTGKSYGRMWFFRDITGRKRGEEERIDLERQMLHVQKLESLGVLAGGIAHDFNNILMAILGNAELARARIDLGLSPSDNLRMIEKSAAQASDLARQMLAYSGKGKFLLENIDLNRLLEEMLPMIEISISKFAVLRTVLDPAIPAVEADATQLRQVVMNLAINASEAIGEKSGTISISTGSMECDADCLRSIGTNEKPEPGAYVCLEVTDTGCGMDKETLSRIYEPFFSTKFAGRGLGLAAVLGIVRAHKGAIGIRSEPGRGSTFKVLLPACGKPAEIPRMRPDFGDWKGEGAVLVVDDEEAVRVTVSEMLRILGFEPLAAEDGFRALEIFRERKDIRFVILDLTMPRMGGKECFRRLLEHDPGVKVILTSGYDRQDVSRGIAATGPAGFLQKPFAMADFKDVLRTLFPPEKEKGPR